MSARIIIHRFEDDKNAQILKVNIVQYADKSDITFSKWQDITSEIKKKNKEKPRLVVKIISEESFNDINLDSFAQKIDNTDKYLTKINDKNLENDIAVKNKIPNNTLDSSHLKKSNIEDNQASPVQTAFNMNKDFITISPLEYSLEKVIENNARIMENIHMLNRTLNYTKKKEILDIINPKPLRSYPCDTCGKCFVYETGLRRHYTVRHTSMEMQPRWQFVWTCTECFQVWPRQDLALKHSNKCCKSESIECVREIKTSSLLQCEFCERVFTSIPRLLKHSKMHSIRYNFKCNACDIGFSCYKNAEQHWLICPWLKMCYHFSLPKMLLCNTCDRKFKSYDHLYNHRYKSGHFIPKSLEENNCTQPPITVYQCEICGQWFNAIAQLQLHRNLSHPHFDNGMQYNYDLPASTEAF